MPHYCHQVSYTKEAWARLMADPQDRLDIVRVPIEKLGGKLHTSFFAFGAFDVLAITEMPDNMSAAANAMAIAAAVAKARTLRREEHRETGHLVDTAVSALQLRNQRVEIRHAELHLKL